MKVDTKGRQLKLLERMRVQLKNKYRKFFPKVFIENTQDGYIISGWESKDGEMETVVSVVDCSDMDFDFFRCWILGPMADFLGADDEDVNDFIYFGGIRVGSHGSRVGNRDGGKYS